MQNTHRYPISILASILFLSCMQTVPHDLDTSNGGLAGWLLFAGALIRPLQMVAISQDGEEYTYFHFTDNEQDWQQSDVSLTNINETLVFWTGSHFLFIGRGGTDNIVYSSVDGATWQPADFPAPSDSDSFSINDFAIHGPHVIMVGSYYDTDLMAHYPVIVYSNDSGHSLDYVILNKLAGIFTSVACSIDCLFLFDDFSTQALFQIAADDIAGSGSLDIDNVLLSTTDIESFDLADLAGSIGASSIESRILRSIHSQSDGGYVFLLAGSAMGYYFSFALYADSETGPWYDRGHIFGLSDSNPPTDPDQYDQNNIVIAAAAEREVLVWRNDRFDYRSGNDWANLEDSHAIAGYTDINWTQLIYTGSGFLAGGRNSSNDCGLLAFSAAAGEEPWEVIGNPECETTNLAEGEFHGITGLAVNR